MYTVYIEKISKHITVHLEREAHITSFETLKDFKNKKKAILYSLSINSKPLVYGEHESHTGLGWDKGE